MRPRDATIRLYGYLDELAPDAARHGEARLTFDVPRSVKDAIESLGVPHTEVDLLLVDGESVGFDRRLGEGERVSVYPVFHDVDVDTVSRVRPREPPPRRFLLDVHLGRLANHLRLLGFDAWYDNDRDDRELAALSASHRRTLLTRDRGLLMRSRVVHGYLVRSVDPVEQAAEVVRRYDLDGDIDPFTRCLTCGEPLEAVAKDEVLDDLPPRTRREHHRFVRCAGCGSVYWPGSHHERLRGLVDDIRDRARH
jgi:uncharacterized protein